MELSRNGIKRWPGQLSNTLEEARPDETMRKVENLLGEADQLKRSLVGERRNLSPGEKPTRRGADLTRRSIQPAGENGDGMNEILGGLAHGIRSGREFVREQPWFEDLRRLVGMGLWETLSFLHLYTLRDAAMENLGLANTTGRLGDRAMRRHGDTATRRQSDKVTISSTSLTLLIL